MRALLVALALLLLAPAVPAQGDEERLDVRIVVPGSGAPTIVGEGVTLANFTQGERYAFDLRLAANYTTFEVQAGPGLEIARPRQLVPTLEIENDEPFCGEAALGACDYPLFDAFPNADIWDVDGPARVFFLEGTRDALRLRLGVPGPVNATLVLQRDVEPPGFTIRPHQNVSTIGFYQETTTKELALADLQVRARGEAEWIRNPTTVYHFLQRFPVQGLDANTTHEVRVLFTDWAENEVASATYAVTTLPEPIRPIPRVTPASPVPNATVAREGLLVRATFESPESPVPPEGVRLFFDLQEVTDGLGHGPGEVAYTPGALEPGLHTVSVEVTNEAGGRGIARWTFTVEGARTPGLPWWAVVAAAALLAATLQRRA